MARRTAERCCSAEGPRRLIRYDDRTEFTADVGLDSAKGLMRFMVTKGRVTAHVFIDFCRRLIKNAKRPIFLIVDGHPTHRAKLTQEFVRSTNGKLRLFFLPPYSPELNPDELVWRDVKTHTIGRHAVESRGHLGDLALSALRRLQKKPEKIRGFFRSPTTAYAA